MEQPRDEHQRVVRLMNTVSQSYIAGCDDLNRCLDAVLIHAKRIERELAIATPDAERAELARRMVELAPKAPYIYPDEAPDPTQQDT